MSLPIGLVEECDGYVKEAAASASVGQVARTESDVPEC